MNVQVKRSTALMRAAETKRLNELVAENARLVKENKALAKKVKALEKDLEAAVAVPAPEVKVKKPARYVRHGLRIIQERGSARP